VKLNNKIDSKNKRTKFVLSYMAKEHVIPSFIETEKYDRLLKI